MKSEEEDIGEKFKEGETSIDAERAQPVQPLHIDTKSSHLEKDTMDRQLVVRLPRLSGPFLPGQNKDDIKVEESIDQPESDMELGHPPHNDDKESEGTRELNKATPTMNSCKMAPSSENISEDDRPVSRTGSPVEVTVYNDKHQLVMQKSIAKTVSSTAAANLPPHSAPASANCPLHKIISSAYTPAACTRRPAASSAYDMRIGSPYYNTTNAAMFGMGSHSHPHNMYNNELLAAQNRRAYYSYPTTQPYPSSYYQYSASMPSNTAKIQLPVVNKHSRIKPLRRSLGSSTSTQKLSLPATPISPSYMNTSQIPNWSPAAAVPNSNIASSDWVSSPPGSTLSKSSGSKSTTQNASNIIHHQQQQHQAKGGGGGSNVQSAGTSVSMLPNHQPPGSTNGYGTAAADCHQYHQQPYGTTSTAAASANCAPDYQLQSSGTHNYCNHSHTPATGHHHQCRASSNGYHHGSHVGASATSSNYSTYQQQQSYAKQQEEYARKLYTLRYALKSDVFMGYGKNTERYELHTDDRPLSPLKLLEIDETLDWSSDLAAMSQLETTSDDEDRVFSSICERSRLLTR